MAKCIFCETDCKLTKEHIWADWLKAYISKDAPHYTAKRAIVWREGRITHDRPRRVGGDVKSRRVKCVCSSLSYPAGTKGKGCNDGWMGQLQERVKSTVIPLIAGHPLSINERQQKALAAWAVMAVMCSEFGRDDSRTIAQEDRSILYKYQVPPRANWAVWIGDYDRREWVPQWARHVLEITKEETETASKTRRSHNTQSTTFTVGRLYIHCISSIWPPVIRKFQFGAEDRKFLHRIWPIKDAVIAWPPRHTLGDRDADRITSSFFRLVSSS